MKTLSPSEAVDSIASSKTAEERWFRLIDQWNDLRDDDRGRQKLFHEVESTCDESGRHLLSEMLNAIADGADHFDMLSADLLAELWMNLNVSCRELTRSEVPVNYYTRLTRIVELADQLAASQLNEYGMWVADIVSTIRKNRPGQIFDGLSPRTSCYMIAAAIVAMVDDIEGFCKHPGQSTLAAMWYVSAYYCDEPPREAIKALHESISCRARTPDERMPTLEITETKDGGFRVSFGTLCRDVALQVCETLERSAEAAFAAPLTFATTVSDWSEILGIVPQHADWR